MSLEVGHTRAPETVHWERHIVTSVGTHKVLLESTQDETSGKLKVRNILPSN